MLVSPGALTSNVLRSAFVGESHVAAKRCSRCSRTNRDIGCPARLSEVRMRVRIAEVVRADGNARPGQSDQSKCFCSTGCYRVQGDNIARGTPTSATRGVRKRRPSKARRLVAPRRISYREQYVYIAPLGQLHDSPGGAGENENTVDFPYTNASKDNAGCDRKTAWAPYSSSN